MVVQTQSNAEPTTYQRRYLYFCEAHDYEPGTPPNHEFVAWIGARLVEFKRVKGLGRWDRLTEADQVDFDRYLEEWTK